MSASDIPPAKIRKSAPGLPRLFLGLLVGLLILLTALYLNRKIVAREVLVGWLDRQGIAAVVDVERIDLNGFIGSIRVGDEANPDFLAERVEVDYSLTAPWSKDGFGARPSRIRLVAPSLHATWKEGRFSFGSLDPLIERFSDRPVQPEATSPLVLVERGELRLTTAYGPVRVLADARIEDSRLVRLTARMPSSSLALDEQSVRGLTATLDLTTRGDRATISLDAATDQTRNGGRRTEGLTLKLDAVLPYPVGAPLRLEGPATIEALLAADRWQDGNNQGRDLSLQLDSEGRFTGILTKPRFDGQASGYLEADQLTLAGTDFADSRGSLSPARVTLDLSGEAAEWRLTGPAHVNARRMEGEAFTGERIALTTPALRAGGTGGRFEVTAPWTLAADMLGSGDLKLARATGRFAMDMVSDEGLTLTGSLNAAEGQWPLLGPPVRDDVPELVALKAALGDFRVEAPGLVFRSGAGAARLDLTRPLAILPRNGGRLEVQGSGAPMLVLKDGQSPNGQFRLLATRGDGLPEAEMTISNWTLTPGGFRADFTGKTALDFGLGRGLTLAGSGRLENDRGVVTIRTADCLAVTAQRLELGENDVTDLSTGLCPKGQTPLVRIADGGWTVDGRLAEGSGQAPFLALNIGGVRGGLVAEGRPQGLSLDITVDQAQLTDATQPIRFHPIQGQGSAHMRGTSWTGDFALVQGEHEVAELTLAHDGLTGTGGIDIATGELTFAEGGLQPTQLTPLADGLLGAPVTGSARFDGRLDWTQTDGTSGGQLVVTDMDFVSPAGPVEGLEGTLQFTNLAPLTTAPDQTLSARSIEVAGGITNLGLTFTLGKAALTVAGAELHIGEGRISVEPFDIALDPNQAWGGTILLERVQLGDLIAGSGFGDKVELDAVVSGRIPFVRNPDGQIRIASGTLELMQPGRLSIQREVLSGLEAGGGGEDIPPGVVEDLAYQAMEFLAFDSLTARVDSLEGGRLGVLFRIVGRHDPPEHQEIRLGLMDIIRRDFLGKPLSLPSDTGIRLTLDTTFNMDQIISDILALNRARRGEADPEPTPSADLEDPS